MRRAAYRRHPFCRDGHRTPSCRKPRTQLAHHSARVGAHRSRIGGPREEPARPIARTLDPHAFRPARRIGATGGASHIIQLSCATSGFETDRPPGRPTTAVHPADSQSPELLGNLLGRSVEPRRCSGFGENRICWVDKPARWANSCEARAAVLATAREVVNVARPSRNHLLHQHIRDAGWTYEDVADKINDLVERATGCRGLYTGDSVLRLVNGSVSWPHLRYREALCRLFNATPGQLGLANHRAARVRVKEVDVDRQEFLRGLAAVPVPQRCPRGSQRSVRPEAARRVLSVVSMLSASTPGPRCSVRPTTPETARSRA